MTTLVHDRRRQLLLLSWILHECWVLIHMQRHSHVLEPHATVNQKLAVRGTGVMPHRTNMPLRTADKHDRRRRRGCTDTENFT